MIRHLGIIIICLRRLPLPSRLFLFFFFFLYIHLPLFHHHHRWQHPHQHHYYFYHRYFWMWIQRLHVCIYECKRANKTPKNIITWEKLENKTKRTRYTYTYSTEWIKRKRSLSPHHRACASLSIYVYCNRCRKIKKRSSSFSRHISFWYISICIIAVLPTRFFAIVNNSNDNKNILSEIEWSIQHHHRCIYIYLC